MGSSCTKILYVNNVDIQTSDFIKVKAKQVRNRVIIQFEPNGLYFANLPKKYRPKAESTILKTE